MNPQNPIYQPGADLPTPQTQNNDASSQNNSAQTNSAAPKTESPQPATTAQTPVEPVASAPQDPPPVPPPAPVDEPAKPAASTPSPISVPPIAGDSDLIEQEWVDKAKAIVENNKNDPYKLNQQLNQFKAEYIKKRYNREIKVDVDQQ